MSTRGEREWLKATHAARAEQLAAERRKRLDDNILVKAAEVGAVYTSADIPTCGVALGHRCAGTGHLCERPAGHLSDRMGHACRCAAENFLAGQQISREVAS